MNAPMKSRYPESYRRSMADPEGFWAEAAGDDRLDDPGPTGSSTPTPASTAAGSSAPNATPATTPSTATSRSGRGEQAAIIYDSPVTGTKRTHHLPRRCATRWRRSAAVLQELGVGKGDRVIIYMPMIPEAAIAMLACARIGAIHSVVFGGFAATELATRIDDATPKVDPVGVVRHRARPHRALQAAARRGDRAGAATSRRPASSCSGRRPRPR